MEKLGVWVHSCQTCALFLSLLKEGMAKYNIRAQVQEVCSKYNSSQCCFHSKINAFQ